MKSVSVTMTAISENIKMKKISLSPLHPYFFWYFSSSTTFGVPRRFSSKSVLLIYPIFFGNFTSPFRKWEETTGILESIAEDGYSIQFTNYAGIIPIMLYETMCKKLPLKKEPFTFLNVIREWTLFRQVFLILPNILNEIFIFRNLIRSKVIHDKKQLYWKLITL